MAKELALWSQAAVSPVVSLLALVVSIVAMTR